MRDSSLYVPIHGNIWTHPKTQRLAYDLRKSDVATVGHLMRLWCMAQRHAEDGDLSSWSAADIARAAGWPLKSAARFLECLIVHGWICVEDGRQVLHDWSDYGGRAIDLRNKAAEKKARQRTGHQETTEDAPAGDVPGTSRGQAGDVPPMSRAESESESESPDSTSYTARVAAPEPEPNQPHQPPAPLKKATPKRTMGRGVIGLAEQANRPATPAEIPADRLASLSARFTALDGKNGRSTLDERLTALWPSFLNQWDTNGPATAWSRLTGWLGGDSYPKWEFAWRKERERDGHGDITLIASPPPEPPPRPEWHRKAFAPVDDPPTPEVS